MSINAQFVPAFDVSNNAQFTAAFIDTATAGVTCDLSTNQDSNTITSVAAVSITALSAAGQPDNTLAGSVMSAVSATCSATQENNTIIVATSVVAIAATCTPTQENNTITAAGSVAVSATGATTQPNNTLTSSASVAAVAGVLGDLFVTQANNTKTPNNVVYARPDSDGVVTNCTPSSGTNLFSRINTPQVDDSSYVVLNTQASKFAVNVENIADPLINTGHRMSIRCWAPAAVGEDAYLFIKLYKNGGTTLIQNSFAVTVSSIPKNYNFLITTGNADAITDYNDLQVEVYNENVIPLYVSELSFNITQIAEFETTVAIVGSTSALQDNNTATAAANIAVVATCSATQENNTLTTYRFVRPHGDIDNINNWAITGGSPTISDALSEVVANDSTYITGTTYIGPTLDFSTVPPGGYAAHNVRFRAWSTSGTPIAVVLVSDTVGDASATLTQNLTTTPTTYTKATNLTFAKFIDWASLRISFGVLSGEISYSWAEFEVKEVSFSKVVVDGDTSFTQASNTATATAVVPIVAVDVASQASNTLTSTATIPIVGNLSKTQDNNTINASTSNATFGDVTSTQPNNTLSSTAVVPIVAVDVASQASNTLTSTVAVAVNATDVATQASNTLTSITQVLVDAALTSTQSNNTLSSNILDKAHTFCEVTVTQSDNTISSAAQILVNVVLSKDQDNHTADGSSSVSVLALSTVEQEYDTLMASGEVSIIADINISQDDHILISSAPDSMPVDLNVVQDDHLVLSAMVSTYSAPELLQTDIVWVNPDTTPTFIFRDLD